MTARWVDTELYTLKRQFGAPITLCFPSERSRNVRTNQVDVSVTKIEVARAIPFDKTTARKFYGKDGYAARIKNFFLLVTNRAFIIHMADLPSTIKLTVDMYILMRGRTGELEQYNVDSIDDFDPFGKAVILFMMREEGKVIG